MSRYELTDFEWRVIEPLLPNSLVVCLASMIGAF
jgi:transposase